MKAIAELDVDLPGIVEVKSSERQAVVQQDAAIGHIQRGQRHLVFLALAEAFPQRQVKGGVLRQVIARILRVRRSIRESRAVVDVRRGENMPWKNRVDPGVQRVSLIVVDSRESRIRLASVRSRGGTNQATRERRGVLGNLIRVGDMRLGAVPQTRRPQRDLPAADQGPVPG